MSSANDHKDAKVQHKGKENEHKQPVAKKALTEKKQKELEEEEGQEVYLNNELAS